jgi:ATP-binding cassette, subfamily B, bacterial
MRSFPFVRQRDSADCGPACLKMIAKFYGKDYHLEFLRERSYISAKGVSLMGLSDAAESIGFHTVGVRISWDQLVNAVPLPCIVHWNNAHFLIVTKIRTASKFSFRRDGSQIEIVDPAYGPITYNKEDFLKNWITSPESRLNEGVVLLLEPTPSFYDDHEVDDKKASSLLNFVRYVAPYKKYIFQLLLGLVAGALMAVSLPFLTQQVVDVGISNEDLSFITLILIAQLFLSFGQTINTAIQNWITLHVTSRISISLISTFLAKIMRLPISFFDSRTIGDTIQRINDHNRIQVFITSTLINIFYAVMIVTVYSIILINYSLSILLIFLTGSVMYVGWVGYFLKRRRELDHKRFQQLSNNDSRLYELISGVREIKLNVAEKQKRWAWERIQAKLFKVNLAGLALNQYQTIGSSTIDQMKNLIVSFTSALLVVKGELTLGSMLAVQYIIGQLNGPINQFIGFVQNAQDAKISLERLNEVHLKDDEENPQGKIGALSDRLDIRLENVTFQYEGPHSEKVLDSLSCNIPSGKVTAIVGASGSGKSTLLKLILGIYKPVKGKIMVNGLSLADISLPTWRRECGVVMQDGFIFADTISNNISLGDERKDLARVRRAAQIAKIDDFIDSLPGAYNTLIGNNGHGLSGGQKQRILIARAIYKNCKLLLLDEATNSLDTKNEREITQNLQGVFTEKTVIVVAHRISTIKNADQILVMENGAISETGTHEELLEKKGFYFRLIESQL